jgi:TRAP-type mannitol/chloroaromatic compound transport system permease small subunit
MDGILKFSAICDRIARNVGKGCGWMMIPLIAVIMFDVVTRKLDYTRLWFSDFTIIYGYSISTILQDMQWHFHAIILMLSFGYGYLANAHVRVDVFRELFPRRRQAWMEFVLLIMMAVPFTLLMITYAWDLFSLSWHQGEGSDSMTGLDWRWAIKFFVPLGFLITMIAVLATLGRLAAYLFGTKEQQDEAQRRLEIFADDGGELEVARLAAEKLLAEEAARAAAVAKEGTA